MGAMKLDAGSPRGSTVELTANAAQSDGLLAAWQPPAPSKQHRGRRRSPIPLLLLLLVGVAAAVGALCVAAPVVLKAGKNAYRAVIYSSPEFWGRNHAQFPAPHCCVGAACVSPPGGRVAVATLLHSDAYLPLLKQLECTFRKSNPGVELVVLAAAGALSRATRGWLAGRNVTVEEVEPLTYANAYNPRYSGNFIKLRAWNLTRYSALLLVDADVAVTGPLSPLFSLPVEFAGSWDQTRPFGRSNTRLKPGINGGVLLLRPCAAVGAHMLQLLQDQPRLRFSHGAAEQDFLNWYFRYTMMMLPVEYNAMASDSLLPGSANLTVGGLPPTLVHFTRNKPFGGPVPGKPGHQLLCSAEELARTS